MTEFYSFEKVFSEIKVKLDSATKKKTIITLYSFNGIGKTRLSDKFNEINNDGRMRYNRTLCYNAFLEDLFSWNNEEHIFLFDSNSWVAKLIKDEGLQDKIVDNFKDILNTKIEPSFGSDMTEITFSIPSDKNASNIKISRGEESVFIWAVFYTILQTAIDMLNEKEKDRSTSIFNKLKYVIIDDPVSSMDDTNIINSAIKLIETINSHDANNLTFLITTHYPLFYNICFNSVSRKKGINHNAYILSISDDKLILEYQGDSPFGYHLLVKNELQKVIDSENINRYHFNIFRSLLEKTANFLGYNDWGQCISVDDRKEIRRIINLYSHGKLSEMESKSIPSEHKTLFKKTFNEFIDNFKYN